LDATINASVTRNTIALIRSWRFLNTCSSIFTQIRTTICDQFITQ